VKAASRGGQRSLGLAAMGDDPRHHRGAVSTLGEDRSPLDYSATGGMPTSQARYYGSRRIITLRHGGGRSVLIDLG
jgi:hypothetical protein